MLPPLHASIDRVFQDSSGQFTAHLLTNRHQKYNCIKNQFIESWENFVNGNPRVERIFWIRLPDAINSGYKTKIQAGFNVRRRFHGTSQNLNCYFGTNPASPPCNGINCNVCSICKTSFRLDKVGGGGATRMALRYGPGLYFSSVSSKSHDYNEGSERIINSSRRRWRCMFLCNVAYGNAYVTKDGSLPPNHCPPPGSDAVIGESGKDLNFPELVVYDESQAIPTYLIVYSI